jgi:hypothetical protein
VREFVISQAAAGSPQTPPSPHFKAVGAQRRTGKTSPKTACKNTNTVTSQARVDTFRKTALISPAPKVKRRNKSVFRDRKKTDLSSYRIFEKQGQI